VLDHNLSPFGTLTMFSL